MTAAISSAASKSINGLIAQSLEWTSKKALSAAKLAYARHLNGSAQAFQSYLSSKYVTVSRVRNILYRDPIELETLYVPSTLTYRRDYQIVRVPEQDVHQMLNESRALLVEALAGAGKSILLKRLFLRSITEARSKKIPLIFELRLLNGLSEVNLEEALFREVSGLERGLLREQWDAGLAAGIFLILLDGFDEVDPPLKEVVRAQIRDLLRKGPQCHFILTTRPDEMMSYSSEFQRFEILPLTKPEALELINRLPFDTDTKARFSEQVDLSLYESHKSFLERPLLATMMLVTFHEKGNIETGLTRFYQDAFSALFYLHDVRKDGFRRRFHSGFDREKMVRLLRALSIISYLEGRSQFSSQQFDQLVTRALSLARLSSSQEDVIHDLTASLCLIQRDGPSLIFVHRSFQEYFSAEYISVCGDDQGERIISTIAARVATDVTVLMLRDLNQHLVDYRWLLPRLRLLDPEREIVDWKDALEFLELLVSKNRMDKFSPSSLELRDPGGIALAVASRIFSVSIVRSFAALALKSDDLPTPTQSAPEDASVLVDSQEMLPSWEERLVAKANEVKDFVKFAIELLGDRNAALYDEVDRLLIGENRADVALGHEG